jgi:phosphoglycolate phosphatase-like HAD superfamily hydrolase
MGIDHYIDAVTSQLYVQHRKPAPDLIIDCAHHLAVPIEKCLVVGDTKDDILAAKDAGGTGIGILTGMDNYEEMMELKPLAVVNNLKDILAFV